jgi:hypothetical protein
LGKDLVNANEVAMVVRTINALASANSTFNPKVRAEAKLDRAFLSSHARLEEVDRNQMGPISLNND